MKLLHVIMILSATFLCFFFFKGVQLLLSSYRYLLLRSKDIFVQYNYTFL